MRCKGLTFSSLFFKFSFALHPVHMTFRFVRAWKVHSIRFIARSSPCYFVSNLRIDGNSFPRALVGSGRT